MKKKINLNRPEISPEEIAKRKNFDSVLKNHVPASGKPLLKKPWFLSSMVVATVAIIATIILLNKPVGNDQQLTTNLSPEASAKADNQQPTIASDSTALAAFYKSEEAKPCIAPPIKGLNIPYTSYKVIAEKGASLDFKTGSKLVVPKNAFVDENGKAVKGEVELRYREFHDAGDFFVSGIPMTYDSAGRKYQFESAGMMEMLAYQNGKPVNMAPEESINVELASTYKGTEYNLYKLDTVKNNWACLGKDKVKAVKPIDPIRVVEAPAVEQTPEYKTIETKKVAAEKEKETQIAVLPKPAAEPKKPAQIKKEKNVFGFEVDLTDFPELAVYKNTSWALGAENIGSIDALYNELTNKSTIWESATLKEGPKKGENYLLTVQKRGKKYSDLIVYPVYEGKDYDAAMKDFQDKFNKYTVVLDKRKAEEKRIEDEYQAKLIALKQQQDALMKAWETQRKNEFKQMDTEEKVMRAFTINSFGVYNSDCAHNYPKGVLCSASLKAEKNRNLQCYEVYLVDKKRNGLFTYERNPINMFSFDPTSTNMLWTVENGVLYWLKPEDFKTIAGGGGLRDLTLTRVDQKFTDVDQLKSFFNL